MSINISDEEVRKRLEGLIVHVTEEHIREGKEGICSLCPIALAINDAIKRENLFPVNVVTKALVYRDTTNVGARNLDEDVYYYSGSIYHTKGMSEFISHFDQKTRVLNEEMYRRFVHPFSVRIVNGGFTELLKNEGNEEVTE